MTAQSLCGGHVPIWETAVHTGTATAQMLVYFSAIAENQANFAKFIGQGFAYTPIHG